MIRSKKDPAVGAVRILCGGSKLIWIFLENIVPPDSHTGKKKSQKITENISF